MKSFTQRASWLTAATMIGVAQLWAGDFEYNGLKYTTLTDTTCEVKQGTLDPDTEDWTCGNDVSGDIVIPEVAYDGDKGYTVTAIGQGTFVYCSGITSIVVPPTVTSIGRGAFAETSIRTFAIPEAVTTVSRSTFFGCKALESIVIPNSVTEIQDGAFDCCSNLKSVSLSNSLKTIGSFAFYSCESLASLDIPDSVTALGYCSFGSCHSLASLTVGNSLTDFGQFGFYDCTALKSVVIPRSMTKVSFAAFEFCSNLSSISLPNTVVELDTLAFGFCPALVSVEIPNSLKIFGAGAFMTTGLVSVSIPGSVTFMGDGALQECTDLQVVRFEDSDEALEFGPSPLLDSAPKEFYFGRQVDCSTIDFSKTETVAFGEKITSIADSTFIHATAVRTVKSFNTVPPVTKDAFADDTYNHATLYVPEAAIDAYKAAEPWKNFSFIKPISGDNSGLSTVAGGDAPQVSVEGTTIHVSGTGNVRILSLDGATLYIGTGETAVDVAPGLYIVTTAAGATKVVVR